MAPPEPGIEVNENGIPSFDALPLRAGDPHHSAWGLYGDSDQLGTLNRQTDERVASAAKSEIRTGVRISLNWEMDAQSRGSAAAGIFFNRKIFHQEIIDKSPRVINDDVWTFNSQVSSQWDGLRHYAYQREGKFYGGVTMADIHRDSPKSDVNGIHAWSRRGIVGRGILLDWEGWRLSQGEQKKFDHFASDPIPLSDLKACLASQGTELRFGDILIVRSGWMAALARKTEGELAAYREVVPHHFGGVEQSEDVLRWVWDNFSAVAGDQPSFECWPSKRDDLSLHEVLLAGWGCPIGELFDLEELAAHCRREKRWSFFVASEPCNVVGGVASPPNILAIF